MKNITFYILSTICLSFYLPAVAQQKEYKGQMKVTPMLLEQVGDSLYICIEFDMRGVHVDSRRSISLIPVLAGPNEHIMLPEVMVKGRGNYLTSLRELSLMSKIERSVYELNPPYAIIKGYRGKGQKHLLYNKTIAFEAWMKNARLDIKEDLCGCGNPPRSLAVSELVKHIRLEQSILPYEVTPVLTYLQPVVEAVKKREMFGEAFLDFIVSQTNIRPDYMNNPCELKKITDMIDEVRGDAAITVDKISVVGYASPEGSLRFNQQLSEGRAKALVNFLLPKFDYPGSMYHVEFGGENWPGLLDMVNALRMKDKEPVLVLLNDKGISNEQRKNKLKGLLNGEPYRFMVKEYFPALRKAICKIDYEVKGLDVAEAKEVIKTHPRNLSLNEMYLVAGTYEAGSPEFVDLFETAVRIFPNDATANLNAAAAALSRKDVLAAEEYLDKIEGEVTAPEYYNTRGVLLMLKGEYADAEKQLRIAADAGLEAAISNMEELEKKLENIEKLRGIK